MQQQQYGIDANCYMVSVDRFRYALSESWCWRWPNLQITSCKDHSGIHISTPTVHAFTPRVVILCLPRPAPAPRTAAAHCNAVTVAVAVTVVLVSSINNETREARSAEPFFLGFPRKKSLFISDRIRG